MTPCREKRATDMEDGWHWSEVREGCAVAGLDEARCRDVQGLADSAGTLPLAVDLTALECHLVRAPGYTGCV
jgi:hypothetical protein